MYLNLVAIGLILVLVITGVVVLARSLGSQLGRLSSFERPAPTSSPSGPAVPDRSPTVPWRISPDELRPDLPGAEFVGPIDGDFSGPYVTAVDPSITDVWVALTGDPDERGIVVHGIDPNSGRVLWDRPMEGALCAREADPRGLVCAEVLDRDPASGTGRQWRLQLLDPRTGETRRSSDVAGWFNVLHRAGDTVIILEQREPAPHAVLRGFDLATLQPRWQLDLSKQPGHDTMFSENRIIARKDPDHDDVVMDRPRLRDVGYGASAEETGNSGLVALWAGLRTAFVQPRSGKLIMMPRCSRVVDDGRRIWCNEADGAASYSYAGKPLRRVVGPRLAFPGDDGDGVDRNRPVFLDEIGTPISVDLDTGKVGKPYRTPAGSELPTTMSTETVGDATVLGGDAGTALVHPTEDKIIWHSPYARFSSSATLIKNELMVGFYRLDIVDFRTGERVATVRPEGLYQVTFGDRLAGVGPDLICLQQIN